MAKVIIVEDEAVLQKALSIEALGAGFTVFTAGNGEAGLELIRKEKPDAVLLDLMLPKMNGFDVLAALKKDDATKNIPVIILSNMGQDEDRKKGLALGAADYFVKSNTDLEALTEKIKKMIEH